MQSKLFLWFVLMAFYQVLFSTEVDNFTDRDPNLQDIRKPLNRIMELHFRNAIQTANRSQNCSTQIIEKALYSELGEGLLAYFFWSVLEQEIDADSSLDKRRSLKKDSIYQDVSFCQGICLIFTNLGYTLKIAGVFLGSDKIGHFLQVGHEYFFQAYKKNGGNVQTALEYGEYTERTFFGLQTTGVYSYGDLAANYEGMLFWQRITNTDLPKGLSPYFICKNNIWKQIAEFDWADYVNLSWDEANNCSRFKDSKMLVGIQQRIQNLGMSCPFDPKACQQMTSHYDKMIGQSIINPTCFSNL